MDMEKLAASIAKSKAVMKKVEAGDFKPTGDIADRQKMMYDSGNVKSGDYLQQPPGNAMPSSTRDPTTVTPLRLENIGISKIPKAILESFAKAPPIDPTVNMGLSSLTDRVKSLMPESSSRETEQKYRHEYPTDKQQSAPNNISSGTLDLNLIDHIIRTTVELCFEQMEKKTSINEDFQIKIGNKVFGGKLNTTKERKKQ